MSSPIIRFGVMSCLFVVGCMLLLKAASAPATAPAPGGSEGAPYQPAWVTALRSN